MEIIIKEVDDLIQVLQNLLTDFENTIKEQFKIVLKLI